LLFVARAERKIRIEVGRGLEGNLTDSICGRIIRDVISPEFKRGRLYEGLRDGITAMQAAAGGDYGKIPSRRGRRPGGIGLLPMVFFIWFILSLIRRRGRGGRGGGGGLLTALLVGSMISRGSHGRSSTGWHGGGFGGFGGGGGFSGGGASGGW
ncbi:MAG: TPM domain-containing protein, partial [Acidobacteriota bacterium]